jgi:hypothetical protein
MSFEERKLFQVNNMYKNICNDILSESRIKQILEIFLISHGWEVDINWGDNTGMDIEAINGKERWIIEVATCQAKNPAPDYSFVSILGEILQRMDDPQCKYSIALPDIQPFRRLWKRFPHTAAMRTGITALFINTSGMVLEKTASAAW